MNIWEGSFNARPEFQQYGNNALGLFALAIKFRLDDVDSVAAESLTDGNDDKKCDIIYLDRDDGIAVVAQCYQSEKAKQSAPSNKASDLNTAASWLLQRPIDELPDRLRSSATELRDGLTDGTITDLHFWYIHNLPESDNVKQELITVEATATAALTSNYAGKKVKVQALEVGEAKLDEWYQDTLTPILVSDEFKIPIVGGFEVSGSKWNAYVTAIPARFLFNTYRKHKTRLFSANVRDYLGSRKSDANINHGIKRTAGESPQDFWVFNNGLTILVNSYGPVHPERQNKKTLKVSGLSIVNGAQTTGAIGSLSRAPDQSALVPVRFVQTNDSETIYSIMQFNNSQNKVTASDFRSMDPVQKKLREQVARIPDAQYEGGRRGGHSDAISRNPKLLPSYTVGQALAAVHQEPVIAYNQKTNIWVSDKLYSKLFNDETSGGHLVFAYSLLRAVEGKKMALSQKSKKTDGGLTTVEQRQLEFFRHRGATYLFVSAIAACMETFLSRRVPNMFRLSFGDTFSPKRAKNSWMGIVDATAPLCQHLEEAFTDGLKNQERVQKAISTFQSLVQATASANAVKYQEFAQKLSTRRGD